MEEVLKVENVWKRYRRFWVLKKVDFKVWKREAVAVLGRNGSGKSTLVKIVCGLLRPSRGSVYILGEDVHRGLGDYKKKVGVLLHENLLYEELSVRENLEYYARMYGYNGLEDSRQAVEAYEKLGLRAYENYRVAHLSYGWKKRANIVRALLNNPEILVLDEPLSGLDEEGEASVSEIIADVSRDKTVVFTVPNEELLSTLVKKGLVEPRVLRLIRGEVVSQLGSST